MSSREKINIALRRVAEFFICFPERSIPTGRVGTAETAL